MAHASGARLAHGSNSVELNSIENSLSVLEGQTETFRGAWVSTPEQVIYENDFSDLTNPFSAGTNVPLSTPPGANDPALTRAIHINETLQTATLDLTGLVDQTKTVTRVTFYRTTHMRTTSNASAFVTFAESLNGTVVWSQQIYSPGSTAGSNRTDGWFLREYTPTSPLTSMTFGITAQSSNGRGQMAVAGLKVYGLGEPYDVGQFVTHLGRLWTSDVDANVGIPGTSGWTDQGLATAASVEALATRVTTLETATPGAGVPSGLPVGVRATRTGSWSTVANVDAVVNFDAEETDTHGFHDLVTNNSRLTVPAGLGGFYIVTAGIPLQAGSGSYQQVTLAVNGVTKAIEIDEVATTQWHHQTISAVLFLAAGDYVEVKALTGASRTVSAGAHLAMGRLGGGGGGALANVKTHDLPLTTLTGWTTVGGTWTASATGIRQAATADAVSRLVFDTKMPLGEVIAEVEIRIDTAPNLTSSRAGFSFMVPSAGGSGGALVAFIVNSAGNITGVNVEDDALTAKGTTTLASPIPLGTFVKFRVRKVGLTYEFWVAGVLVGSAEFTHTNIHGSKVALYSYAADVTFRNLKIWHPNLSDVALTTSMVFVGPNAPDPALYPIWVKTPS